MVRRLGDATVDVENQRSARLGKKFEKTAEAAIVDVGVRRSARLREKYEKTAGKGNDESRANERKTKSRKRQPSPKKPQPKKKARLSAMQSPAESEGNNASQLPPDSNWKGALKWLHPRRDVGLWIECCRESCGKWRYNEEIHDPLDVPEIWYCEMNRDRSIANCDCPEEEFPPGTLRETIVNKYNAGSIVWARLAGFPWWPAMVDDCPYSLCYYRLGRNSVVPVAYNVVFFEDDIAQTSWLPVANIKPYKTNPKEIFLRRKRMTFRSFSYRNQVDRACELADRALPLSIRERLEKFSFVAHWPHDNATRSRTSHLCSQPDSALVVSATLTPSSAHGGLGIGGISASSSPKIPISIQRRSTGYSSGASGSSHTDDKWDFILSKPIKWSRIIREPVSPGDADRCNATRSNEKGDISQAEFDEMDLDQMLEYFSSRRMKST